MRYHTTDHNGQTRAERNRLADHPVPERKIPEHGRDIWLMFWQLSVYRVERNRISPVAVAEWLRLHGQAITAQEMAAIEAMDRQFLETLAEETRYNDERRNRTKPKFSK